MALKTYGNIREIVYTKNDNNYTSSCNQSAWTRKEIGSAAMSETQKEVRRKAFHCLKLFLLDPGNPPDLKDWMVHFFVELPSHIGKKGFRKPWTMLFIDLYAICGAEKLKYGS